MELTSLALAAASAAAAVAVKEENAHPHPSSLPMGLLSGVGFLAAAFTTLFVYLMEEQEKPLATPLPLRRKEGEGPDHNRGVRNAVYEA